MNSIGQFSMPILTFRLSAWAIRGLQVSRNRGQLSSTDKAGSRPTKVFTTPTPSAAAASINFGRCAAATSASAAIGRQQVW